MKLFENIDYLYLLALVPILLFLYLRYSQGKRNIQKKLGNSLLIDSLTSNLATYRQPIKFALLIGAVVIIILAIANPAATNKRQVISGASKTEIIFAIDVSKSMLTRDVVPNRFVRAQAFITNVINNLHHGEQVAVVIFAGQADTYVPMTGDYNFVKREIMALSDKLISKQGTSLRDALKISSLILTSKKDYARAICVVSDGETDETNFAAFADTVKKSGINLFAIGLGTSAGGNIIEQNADNKEIIKTDKNGAPVISRLQEENLKKLTGNMPGHYYQMSDKELATNIFITEIKKLQDSTQSVRTVEERYFQLFLLAALILLTIEFIIR